MITLPPAGQKSLPTGLVLDALPFVPRLVMTEQLQLVVNDVIHQWHMRQKFAPLLKYGIRPLDRLLFYGPPGNGKTMACHWLARELKIPMYRVACSALRNDHLGGTLKNVEAVMNFLNELKEPALCLWDEAEAIFIDRKRSTGQCDREIQAALTVFLQQLDRWKAPTLIVLATNLIDQLDDALLSRVEMRIEFTGPNIEQCEQLLEYWSELLHDHGGSDWRPTIGKRVSERLPQSFRELTQTIAYAAREWTARSA